METQNSHWLPLTEYALRSGMSISTLRRKIKANSIQFKMEDGRYLIRSDKFSEISVPNQGFQSNDGVRPTPPIQSTSVEAAPSTHQLQPASAEVAQIAEDLRQYKTEDSLRWRALEARVAGLAKKLELFTEQMAEVKMLVKIFEEKLDRSV